MNNTENDPAVGCALERRVRGFGFIALNDCIGHNCAHGMAGKWYKSYGRITHITKGGKLSVKHWDRNRIVSEKMVVDIYSDDGRYGIHRNP